MMEEVVSSEKSFLRNVLVIGSNGVGKSSLCNFLGQTSKLEARSGQTSCTRAVQTTTIVVDGISLCFIDTPGLNEPRFSDELINIHKFLTSLSEHIFINYVIFVSNASTRFDAQTQSTLSYFTNVFSDIIRPDNFHCICTHYGVEDFQDDQEFPEQYDAKVMEIKKIFEKEYKFELLKVDYVNLNPNKINKPSRNDVYAYTHQVRDDIYQVLKGAPMFPLVNALYRLPPVIDLVFKNALSEMKLKREHLLRGIFRDEGRLAEVQGYYMARDELIKEHHALQRKFAELYKEVCIPVKVIEQRRNFTSVLNAVFGTKIVRRFTGEEIIRELRSKGVKNPNKFKITCQYSSLLEAFSIYEHTDSANWTVSFVPSCTTFQVHIYALLKGGDMNHLEMTQTKIAEAKVEKELNVLLLRINQLVTDPQIGKIDKFIQTYSKNSFYLNEIKAVLKIFQDHKLSREKFIIVL